MYIEKLYARSNAQEWEIEHIDFQPFNLLVGASGVGKTKLLQTIFDLTYMGKGHAVNGIVWDMKFKEDGKRFQWSGETEYKDEDQEKSMNGPPIILSEKLICDNQVILERTRDELLYKNKKLPQLTINQSAISMIQEDEILSVNQGFFKVYWSSFTYHPNFNLRFDPKRATEFRHIQDIQATKEPILAKLYYTFHAVPDIFDKIKLRYQEIFPQIEDLQMDILEEYKKNTVLYTPLIQIKHFNVNRLIDHREMSSGMLHSLLHLAELYLCPSESVLLIDEFENGLGVNCMDEVSKDMQSMRKDLQFMITSHHPYIINAVDFQDWKLVTRNGGKISTHDASEFNLGKSRHKAFTQLVNLEAYQTGRMPEQQEAEAHV